MAREEKAKESHREPWQPSEGGMRQIPIHDDSPPAYHTMYPGVGPNPSLIPPKKTCINTHNLAGEEMKAQKDTQKDKWAQLEGGKRGDLQSDHKPTEYKQKEKSEVKPPIIVFSKETKQRLLKKTHGARDTLRYCSKMASLRAQPSMYLLFFFFF